MGAGTLFGFLVGRAAAIREVARHPRALWVGAAFVLAAALAREYDKEDLLHEPWHLLIPFVASLATSLLLHQMLFFTFRPLRNVSWRESYRSFLALYWWTAPLALLYGIPFERWSTPAGATSLNLALLGLVSLWRVVLITRATAVAWSLRFLAVLPVVLAFASIVVVMLLSILPLPLVSLMGGVQLSESEWILREVTNSARFFSVLLLPSLAMIVMRRVRGQRILVGSPRRRPGGSLVVDIVFFACMLLIGFFLGAFSTLFDSEAPSPPWAGLFLLAPAIAVGGALGLTRPARLRTARDPNAANHEETSSTPLRAPLPALAVLLIVPWLFLLPVTQGAQQNRRAVETALRAGDLAGAVRLVGQAPRASFPPHWDPPPRPHYGDRTPRVADVVLASLEHQAPSWFTWIYLERQLDRERSYMGFTGGFGEPAQALRFGRLRQAWADYPHIDELRDLAPVAIAELEQWIQSDKVILPGTPEAAAAEADDRQFRE